MVVSHARLERLLEWYIPLLVMSVYMTLAGRGFLTLWPVLACTVYTVAQPFFQFFLFDRIRPVLFEAGQARLFLLSAAVIYTLLALAISRLFT